MVKKETLLLLAGLVWGAAGFNILRIGLLAYPGHVTLWNLAWFLFGNKFFTEFYKFLVNLFCKILTSGKCCNTDGSNRGRFFK